MLIVLYYSLLVLILTATVIAFNGISNTTNLMDYDKEQYVAALVPGIFYTGAVFSLTIAMQNERPGFVALLGYMGLVYTLIGDTIIHSQTLFGQELLGISIILTLNVTLVFKGLSQSS